MRNRPSITGITLLVLGGLLPYQPQQTGDKTREETVNKDITKDTNITKDQFLGHLPSQYHQFFDQLPKVVSPILYTSTPLVLYAAQQTQPGSSLEDKVLELRDIYTLSGQPENRVFEHYWAAELVPESQESSRGRKNAPAVAMLPIPTYNPLSGKSYNNTALFSDIPEKEIPLFDILATQPVSEYMYRYVKSMVELIPESANMSIHEMYTIRDGKVYAEAPKVYTSPH